MFLRIDKVTGVNNAPPIPSTNNDSSSPPLHACLATAVTRQKEEEETVEKVEGTITDDNEEINEFNASGELFVVGRKNAAVTIDDKVRSLSVLLILLYEFYCV